MKILVVFILLLLMLKTSLHITRIVVLLLMAQFTTPAFRPAVLVDEDNRNRIVYQPVHTSVLIPLVLKKKEENKFKDGILSFVSAPLIDFTDHTLALTRLHQAKYNPVPCGQWYDHQPPLFALNCTFVI